MLHLFTFSVNHIQIPCNKYRNKYYSLHRKARDFTDRAQTTNMVSFNETATIRVTWSTDDGDIDAAIDAIIVMRLAYLAFVARRS